MRRRNCSLTENLEPRLVLSPLSFRGSVDPPRSTPTDSAPRNEIDVVAFTRDSQSQVSQRQFVLSDVYLVPVAEVPVLTPVDPPDTGTTPSDSVLDIADEPGVIVVTDDRTVLSDGGTVGDDLADDSLSTDDRTSVLVDSVADADRTRADEESDAEETVDVIGQCPVGVWYPRRFRSRREDDAADGVSRCLACVRIVGRK
jgi:hypothetical protein